MVDHAAGRCFFASLVAITASPVDARDRRRWTSRWHQEAGYRWRALDFTSGTHTGFTRLSARATGITHRNDVDDEHAMANRNLLIGAGAALGDIDGDGRPDVFLASVEQPAALYHNDGGFHFTDVTATSGIDTRGLATTGAAFADVDGDGDLDLLCGTLGGPLKLWLNDGKGHFTDATATSGLTGGYAATTRSRWRTSTATARSTCMSQRTRRAMCSMPCRHRHAHSTR